MNLLFLTPSPPYPPHSGTALRNWGLTRELALRHEITLLSFASTGRANSVVENTLISEKLFKEIVLAPAPPRSGLLRGAQQFSRRPDLCYRLGSSSFDAALRRQLDSGTFDIVQIEGLEMAGVLEVIRASPRRVRVVYDAHNVEYALQRGAFWADIRHLGRWSAALYSLMQWPRLKRYEAWVCQQADMVCCVSDQDAQALMKVSPRIRTVVIPNGLRMAEYPFVRQERPVYHSYQGTGSEGESLIFTGKMDYRPNRDAADWFVKEILPLIQLHNPAVRLAIVGQNPPNRPRPYGQSERVLLVGAVPDTQPYITSATVYVMPLRMGGGTRFKLLEAMALGIPVVSTSKGAEGFPVAHERELLIADGAEGFARAVLRLLDDANLRERLSYAGRKFVEAAYDWSAIVPRLEAAYLECVAGSK